MAAVANVSIGQTDMSCKGELQTLTKLSVRHQICPGENCCTTKSESHYNNAQCPGVQIIAELHIM